MARIESGTEEVADGEDEVIKRVVWGARLGKRLDGDLLVLCIIAGVMLEGWGGVGLWMDWSKGKTYSITCAASPRSSPRIVQ